MSEQECQPQEWQPMDIKKILELLPHRYPFIMVDRIVEMVTDEWIRGYKNVSVNENFFQGHFPAEPVMPGVLILEGMAQTGAILAYLSKKEDNTGKLVYFTGLEQVKFRRMVVPGDRLYYEITALKRRSRFWFLGGKAFVDDQLVAEAQLMATFA